MRSLRSDRPATPDGLSRAELLFLIVLFIAAVSARVAWAYANASQPLSDFLNYYNAAVKTAESGRLSDYAVYKGPGTVVILALWMKVFGTSLHGVFWLNALMGGVSVLGTYSLARELSLRRAVATLSAVSVAVYPDFLSLTALVASENFALPALLLGAIAFVRVYRVEALWGVLLLGAVIGATLLIRPLWLLAIPFLLLAFLWGTGPQRSFGVDRRRVVRALVWASGIAIVVLPWSAYASHHAREPVLISRYSPIVFYCAHNPLVREGWYVGFERVREIIPDYDESNMFRQTKQYALRYCMEHPEHLVENAGVNIQRLFEDPSVQSAWVVRQQTAMRGESIPMAPGSGGRYNPLRLAWLSAWIFSLAWRGATAESVLVLIWRRSGRARWIPFFFANLLVYHTVLVFGDARFLTPWLPILMMGACALPMTIYDIVRPAVEGRSVLRHRSLGLFLAAVVLAGALVVLHFGARPATRGAKPGVPTEEELLGFKELLGPSASSLTASDVSFAGVQNAVSLSSVEFDRFYGRPNVVMVTRAPKDSYEVTFAVAASSDGAYAIYSKYSSMEPRPVMLTVNGGSAITICEEGLTTSWQNSDSILVRESETIELKRGVNSVKLASRSVFPHIERVYFVRATSIEDGEADRESG